ncbi:hypothetical protein MMC09_001892 [Bachmanniomyces sp. S44760]|nr:hypothetical protein [Bachmanniomyces sp. S44760]
MIVHANSARESHSIHAKPSHLSEKSPPQNAQLSPTEDRKIPASCLPPSYQSVRSKLSLISSPRVSIAPIAPNTLPHFRRLIALLLPIRYPERFFTETVSNPDISAISRVALWTDEARNRSKHRRVEVHANSEGRNEVTGQSRKAEADQQFRGGEGNCVKQNKGADGGRSTAGKNGEGEGRVIGGIRCRLEDVSNLSGNELAVSGAERRLYIQTLAVLSPYRSRGIARDLLDSVISSALSTSKETDWKVTEVYAHVWEANEEALRWYGKRGFKISEDIEKEYYRRLKPSGARVVRRKIWVRDYFGDDNAGTNAKAVSDSQNP